MKRCPTCNRTYTDETLRFCLDDGTPLTAPDQLSTPTVIIEPPPTVPYRAGRGTVNQPQRPWTPPPPKPKRKVWPWVLGGLVVVFILGSSFILLLIGLNSLGSNSNSSNSNTNTFRTESASNTNSNSNANSNSTANQNSATADVEISSAYMARDNSGEPGEEVQSFQPSDRIVHCVVKLSEAQTGTIVKFKWFAVDAGEDKNELIKELDYTTKPNEDTVKAHLTFSRDWTAGEYKVDVYLNDQFARSVPYKREE